MLWNRGRGLFANIMSAEFGSALETSYKYSLKGENQEGKAVTVLLYKNSAELWEASFAGGEDVDGFGRGLTIAEMDEEDMFEERAEVLVDVVRCEADARGIRLADTSSTGASAGTPNHRTAAAAPVAVTPDDSVRETDTTNPSDGANDIANAANILVAAVNDQQTKLTETKSELAETKAKLAEANEALAKTKEENAKLTQENENLRVHIQQIGVIANKINDNVNV